MRYFSNLKRILHKKDSGGLQIKINKHLWLILLKVYVLNLQQVQFAKVKYSNKHLFLQQSCNLDGIISPACFFYR